jgi:hypothetical protein
MSKDQRAETLSCKEPTAPVPNVEPAFSPLDEQLGLQPGSLSPLQLQHLVHFASLHSFGQAAKMLKEHHGVEVSASTARRQTEELGACAEAVQNEHALQILRQKNSTTKKEAGPKAATKQVISSDGCFISLRGKQWVEVKTVLVGEVEENASPSQQRPHQEVKTVHLSYFSRMSDAATFIELASGEMDRRGVLQAPQVAAVADGAEWIQSFVDAHRADAVRILDFYHAAEYVSEIASLLSNAGTPLRESWLAEQFHELRHRGPAKVLAEVGRLLKDHPQVEDLQTKVQYLHKREELMHYPRFEQDGWPIGSGSVESANSCVVQQRLKGPGMHWEGRNVNPMLALRLGLCNDRWQETMQQASRQRLLSRRTRRCARQKTKYDELSQKVKRLLLRLFLLLAPSEPKPASLPVAAAHRERLAAPSRATLSRPTRRPASSHPWRRYFRAKK